jgi:hypothetical protein
LSPAETLIALILPAKSFLGLSANVPAVYEMCRIAHFTYFQNSISGVISLPYNELALLVQRIYISANLRHCGCGCNIRKWGLYEGKGCFFSVSTETALRESGVLLPVL